MGEINKRRHWVRGCDRERESKRKKNLKKKKFKLMAKVRVAVGAWFAKN